jgi:acyl-coenzyme A thioesterase PaaI-like protein
MNRKELLLKFVNFWPPFVGAGIRVLRIGTNSIDVRMKMRLWNKNYMGTHFGGSIYAMTDPFFMMILIKNLGPDYLVWDKAANIRFIKPGIGTITAHFEVTPERLAQIKTEADAQYKVEPEFTVEVKNEAGEVVAIVEKLLYVRRHDRK